MKYNYSVSIIECNNILSSQGEEGVVEVLEMLREEFKITMMLSGMNHFINMSH